MPAPILVAGAPCWIDLHSADTGKATTFDAGLFGWDGRIAPEGFGGCMHSSTRSASTPGAP